MRAAKRLIIKSTVDFNSSVVLAELVTYIEETFSCVQDGRPHYWTSGNLRYFSEKVTHGRNSAHFVFSKFLNIFWYGESNAKSCQAKKIREIRLFLRIKYDVIMYILCTFANIMT